MSNNRTWGGIEQEFAGFNASEILLQPIPYDGTSTWGKGADKGFPIFLEASENMELYDIETNSEVYRKGIHILPEISEKRSPERVYKTVLKETTKLLTHNKFLTFFGGEHSISIGIIEAFRQKYSNLTVLHLDAHADLRPEYLGSKYNHACAMHQASQNINLVQVGIRSMDISEKKYLNPQQCYFSHQIFNHTQWMNESINQTTDNVYISLDLDALDPAIMPATGTPEPGGFEWDTLLQYLKKVFQSRNVVGFDIVEFAPIDQFKAPDFLVAKLYYKMLSYKYHGK